MKRLLSALLILAISLSLLPPAALPASAKTCSGSCGNNLTWELDTASGAMKISGTGDMARWSFSTDVPWDSLRSSIKTVVIGDGVTSINYYSFAECPGLTSVSIPGSVTIIEERAFCQCPALKSITIPSGVTTIELAAFENCTALTGVAIPAGVTRLDNYAFVGCTSLVNITISDSVTEIGTMVFYDTGYYNNASNWTNGALYIGKHLIEVKNIPDPAAISVKPGTRTIAAGAFFSVETPFSVSLPASLTHISKGAFTLCSGLTGISVDADNPVFDSRNDCGAVIETATGTLILGCGNTAIPDGVTRIGDSAFSGCGRLTNLVLPDSVTAIGANAFNGCAGLTGLTIPDSVTAIGESAFYGCSGLTGLSIPDGLTEIGDLTFAYCSGLKSISLPGSVKDIGCFAFIGCDALKDVYFRGSEDEWNAIKIDEYNGRLTGASVRFSAPHAHSYTDAAVAPTCAAPGYTIHTCSICGISYTDTLVPALGHTYADGVCTVCGARDPDSTPVEPIAFSDVKETAWYFGAVNYAVSKGLFNGMSETTFEPNTPMSRAMLVTVLWRYEGSPKEGANTFTDVPADRWYTDAVAWAAANGIVGGVGSGRFDPNSSITREQMAAILFRYAQGKGYDTGRRGDLTPFPDRARVSDWARDAIEWAVAEGIIGGSDGRLLPRGSATRAQVAAILMRFIEKFAK